MRNALRFYIVLSSIICIILATSMVVQSYPLRASAQGININTKEIKNKEKLISIDLKIPVLEDMKNTSIQKDINTMIEKRVMDFKGKVLTQLKEYKKEAKKNGLKFNPFEASGTYFVSFNNNGLLSLTLELYSYTGGAHGLTERVSYNIDLNSGKNLQLKDLFKEGVDFKSVINREIQKKIASSQKGMYFEGTFKGITDNQPYYIKNGTIVIYFPVYELAPYVAGFPEFVIPFSLFNYGVRPVILV